jgi:translation initiation factor 2B subunit (eIF-2B alpha/beta/delta family)
MKTVNVLHLSDLHIGWPENEFYFETFRDVFYSDLKKMGERSGGIDLVLFSGDLTYSGEQDQFIKLSGILTQLWDFFKSELSSCPSFLCVPGNHDLTRPAKYDPEKTSLLSKYFNEKNFRDFFWKDFDHSKYGQAINSWFANYTDWKNNLDLPDSNSQKKGILPGDFSARFEKNGISIGIVGLNSAFLHLEDGDFKGKIDINTRQLYMACDGDPVKWLSEVDFQILMTHHGHEWLEDTSKSQYFSEIYTPERFVFHLCGHVHDAKAEIQKINGSSDRRFIICKSLFGMKYYDATTSTKNLLRDHGYSLIQMEINKSSKSCKIWPRKSVKRGGGNYELDKDVDFSLSDEDDSLIVYNKIISKPKKQSSVAIQLFPEARPSVTAFSSLYEAVRKKRAIFITDNRYLDILNEIENHVKSLWSKHIGPPWQPLHDHNHNIQVEHYFYRLIPDNKIDKLQSYEWFILLSAIWLHEIGMIIGLFEDDEKHYISNADKFALSVRNKHHERSVHYLNKMHETLKITRHKELIAECCFRHRKYIPLPKQEFATQERERINLNLLIAYLRLALAIHLDQEVEDEKLFDLMHTPGLSWEDRFHWQKRKWIGDVRVSHDSYLLTILAYKPPENSYLVDIFPEKLIEDMREALVLVRDILAKGGISFFYDVNYEDIGTKNEEEHIHQMQLIRSNIDVEEVSSASEAYNTVLSTFERFTRDDVRSYKLIHSYFDNIEKVLKSRPCHTLMRNLNEKLSSIFSDPKKDEGKKIDIIRELITQQTAERDRIEKLIAQNAKPLLLNKESILVYGYSSKVIGALRAVPIDILSETEVYVAECRGKTQFNLIDQMVYNDGLHYIKKLKECGVKKTYFIPDNSIANFMRRGLIKKILFGANGIDQESGNFGHTSGHLMIADLAIIYNIPLYVIADSSKIGKLEYRDYLNRDIRWLPKYKGLSDDKSGISFLNPREDTVEANKITMIITEKGIQFPKRNRSIAKISRYTTEFDNRDEQTRSKD